MNISSMPKRNLTIGFLLDFLRPKKPWIIFSMESTHRQWVTHEKPMIKPLSEHLFAEGIPCGFRLWEAIRPTGKVGVERMGIREKRPKASSAHFASQRRKPPFVFLALTHLLRKPALFGLGCIGCVRKIRRWNIAIFNFIVVRQGFSLYGGI